MRKFLYALMMLIMLTPSLACAATVCASMDTQAKQEMPCHGEKQEDGKDSGLMFFKDCSGVDLAQADHNATVKKPDVQIDKIVYSWTDLAAEYSFLPTENNQIRGPPIQTAEARTYPPLYLTTQRLRI